MSYLGWEPEDTERYGDLGNWIGLQQERVRARREERARQELAALKAQLREPAREFAPLATGPTTNVGSFSLYAKPKPRRDARSRQVDTLLEKHLGPRHRTRAENTVTRTRKPKAREVWSGGDVITRSMGSVLRVR